MFDDVDEELRGSGEANGSVPANDGGGISVVLGHFGPVIGRGLRQVLSDDRDVRIVGMASDHETLEIVLVELAPQVVVLDEASVAPILGRLRAVQPEIGVVVLAHLPTRAYAARLLASGIKACLSIDASAREILGAIRRAADVTNVPTPPPPRSIQAAEFALLTDREYEVARLITLGYSNAQIAGALHISIETVRTHAKHIFAKLGISARHSLVGIDMSHGFR
jgi:DNA-binding NarL/FixJ family response regulator